jgi:hypothetical protein
MPEGLWAPLVRCSNDLVGLVNGLVELCRADLENTLPEVRLGGGAGEWRSERSYVRTPPRLRAGGSRPG